MRAAQKLAEAYPFRRVLPTLSPGATRWISLVTATVLVIGGFMFLVWRTQFGVDLTDEPAYLAFGTKLMALGDKPYVDEIYVGPKNFYVLNHFLLHPLLPFSVLTLRVAAVVTFAAVLMALTLVSFGGAPGVLGALGFFVALLFDRFNQSTWSHNFWSRDLVILHHVFLLWASRSSRAKYWWAAAGLAMGTAVVAYNTLVAAAIVTFLALAFFVDRAERLSRWYFAGLCLPIAAYVGYVVHGGLAYAWYESWIATSLLTIYDRPFFFGKLLPTVQALFTSTWWLTIAIAAFFARSAKRPFLPEWPLISRRPSVRAGAVLAILGYFALQFTVLKDSGYSCVSYLGLAVGGGAVLVLLGLRDFLATSAPVPTVSVLALSSLALISSMGISSTTGTNALFWMAPSVLIPFLGWFRQNAAAENRAGVWLLGAWLSTVAAGALYFQLHYAYEDSRPIAMNAEVEAAPYSGLRTNARRAFLVDELAKVVTPAKFALAHMAMPGIFMFGDVRSSTDALFEDLAAPLVLQKRSLVHMAERGRFPDVMVVANTHPWSWGLTPVAMTYPSFDPIMVFIRCAAAGKIVDYDEFTAYRVNQENAPRCVGQAVETPES